MDNRRLALALHGAGESADMGHPDFRVRNRIFATLWPNELRGAVLLTPRQQRSFVQRQPETFAPVPGGWGRRGSTNDDLKSVGEADAKEALAAAWRNKAP